MNIYTKTSIRIIITFSLMMGMSVITSIPEIQMLMGDTKCNQLDFHAGTQWHLKHWHYGWAHWLYMLMGLLLFMVQIVRTVMEINKKTN